MVAILITTILFVYFVLIHFIFNKKNCVRMYTRDRSFGQSSQPKSNIHVHARAQTVREREVELLTEKHRDLTWSFLCFVHFLLILLLGVCVLLIVNGSRQRMCHETNMFYL